MLRPRERCGDRYRAGGSADECVGYPFGNRTDAVTPCLDRPYQPGSQAWSEAACSVTGLAEVGSRECALRDGREYVGVDDGPYGFHGVERERGSAPLVGVEDPEQRVKADRVTGQDRFGFQESVKVVEDRVGRVA